MSGSSPGSAPARRRRARSLRRAAALEVLQQCIGRVVVEQVSGEEEVHPGVRLERPQVEVVVKLTDDVDADHVAEWLDDPQVRMRTVDRLAAGHRAVRPRTRRRPRSCPHRQGRGRGTHALHRRRARRSTAAWPRLAQERFERLHSISSASNSVLAVPSTITNRSAVALCELPVGTGRPRVEAVFLALDPVALPAHSRRRRRRPGSRAGSCGRASAPRRRRD